VYLCCWMPFRHVLLALAIVAVWGTNFVVIKESLEHLPPLLFATLRFVLAVLPAIFFLRRPAVPIHHLALYGLFGGAGQFGLLYLAIEGRIPPGLASLVLQTQVFFTIALAMWISREPLRSFQAVAVGVSTCGLLIVAAHLDASTTLWGLLLVIGAAFSWACANMMAKRAVGVNMLAYVVWSSAFSIPVLFILSLATEGWDAIQIGVCGAGLATWGAVVWQSWANALFGFAAWGWLLSRHSAAAVVPMALLVPVFGISASAIWLGEPLPPWKLYAFALVLTGLAINVFWPRVRAICDRRVRV
jgi:O-acetylserine/cysteine efflux transporter